MSNSVRETVLQLAKQGADPKDHSPGSLETVKIEGSGGGPLTVTFRFRPTSQSAAN